MTRQPEHYARSQYYNFKVVSTTSHSEQQTEAVRRFFEEVWNRGDLTVLDELVCMDVTYEDRVWHEHKLPGRRRLRNMIQEVKHGYPDFTFNLEHVLARDDSLVCMAHWTATCTNQGDFLDRPASGRISRLSGMHMFVFDRDARIVEITCYRQPTDEERSQHFGWEGL
ncbi:hypothetical protein WJX72_002584 [[Myrmecia] bisecta]|uniref:SnoaL-like polyketide cyclase n=1 Tax=[Myrmecia] bisecta TaxID=41462 RepID=A0AAW1R571_9CHLO